MLAPKKSKFRKAHKGRIHGIASRGCSLAFGEFGLKALEPERITARQIEAARKAIVKATSRRGKLHIRIFPDVPVSKKPAEVRMGSGKGSPEYFVVRIHPGKIMFELAGVTEEVARIAFAKAAAKLPIKAKFVKQFGEEADVE
jgi:large subunit ribosomal protein L16